ncbi:uncharacterized protein PGTG_00143 [Puccinia graminis f. sp. tritici CRL 75-36-700-3]|uniref:Uncharacterized protein n=1 Tax=Puccinia graminis f. sp. tritici (strain CRL 75-36-700-3 / race SCCL) TaxID=418459 RepID=E3JR75_PUCGT|nr:uncharacterized protein PGTG_00143 [Puccinia graminis f. sp. tritici CRL 75-36-700-3]EFP74187.2 hypothetical protein PGTG_00143 [Puccinia graminis f. sp. tritici CRL 75-36-700-3]
MHRRQRVAGLFGAAAAVKSAEPSALHSVLRRSGPSSCPYTHLRADFNSEQYRRHPQTTPASDSFRGLRSDLRCIDNRTRRICVVILPSAESIKVIGQDQSAARGVARREVVFEGQCFGYKREGLVQG